MIMKKNNLIFLFTLVLLSINILQVWGQKKPQAIAHALGSIDGYTYTNCREAMMNSIEKGYKFIEVDIDSTSDGVFIASHDWGKFNRITNHSELNDSNTTYEDFSKRKIHSKYTPITIQEVVDTMMNHPDIAIVTDKISNPVIIEKLFSSMKERTYVECFSENDYFELKDKGYHAMLSSYYMDNFINSILANMIRGRGVIDFVATSNYLNFKELRKLRCTMPIEISMFTINTDEFLDEHLEDMDLFYSDFFDPSTESFNDPNK